MHGRYARYTYTGDVQELAQKAEAGILPIFQAEPGFKGYSVLESDGEILSFSVWESAEAAEAANATAAEWMATNIGDRMELQETRIAEILFSSVFGLSTKAGASA